MLISQPDKTLACPFCLPTNPSRGKWPDIAFSSCVYTIKVFLVKVRQRKLGQSFLGEIFCYIWINILYRRHFPIIYHIFSTFNTKNRENIVHYRNTLFWLDNSRQSPSKSVKVSRKIGWSSIPSKSVQVLWWTLIKVFFDRLHYQSLRQKLWPSFLVQENFDIVNGPLVKKKYQHQ